MKNSLIRRNSYTYLYFSRGHTWQLKENKKQKLLKTTWLWNIKMYVFSFSDEQLFFLSFTYAKRSVSDYYLIRRIKITELFTLNFQYFGLFDLRRFFFFRHAD